MVRIQVIVAIIAFSITLLSLFSSISPKTPFGKYAYNKFVINDEKIDYFFSFYKVFIAYVISALGLLVLYLFFSFIDFYSTQSTVFNIMYFMPVVTVIVFIFSGDSSFLQEIINKILLFLVYLIMATLYFTYMYNYSNNKNIENIYKEIRSQDIIFDELMEKDNAHNINGYIKNYENYIIFSSYVNRLVSYVNRTRILPKFNIQENEPSPLTEQRSLELELIHHIESNFNDPYKKILYKRAKDIFESPNVLSKNIFPLKLEPRFISSTIIYNYSNLFSRVAITTKVLIVYLYQVVMKDNLIYFGIIIISQILLFAYLVASFFKKYNEKYDREFNNEYYYYFTIIGLLSLIIGIYSMLL